MAHPSSKTLVAPAALLTIVCGTALAAPVFAPPASTAAASAPSASALGDFDRDGDLDVAVTADNPDRVLLFTNTGGSLGPVPTPIFTGNGTSPDSMVSSDVDSDGDADLLVVLKNVPALRVYLNAGTGVFTAGALVPLGDRPQGLIARDLDGDGDDDYVVVDRNDSSMTVMRNAAGVLTPTTTMIAGGVGEPRAVAAGHFNGDALVDLAITEHEGAAVHLFFGTGAAAFTAGAVLPIGGAVRPDGIASGDLDGDGDADLAVTTSDASLGISFLSVFVQTPGGLAGPANYPTGGANAGPVAVADLDFDGDADAAVVNQGPGTLVLMNNAGGGQFSAVAPAIFTGAGATHLALGRLDANTSLDAVVVNRDQAGGTVSVVLNVAVPPVAPCGPADLAGAGASAGADGALDNNDFIRFIDLFFAANPAADTGSVGGVPGPDGTFDNNDFVVFIDRFFAGC